MYMADFGARLKKLRKERAYTQTFLAEKLHVSQNTILRWENNYKFPTPENLIELARLFHVTLDYLVGIDQSQSVAVDALSQEQITVLKLLILEFQSRQKGTGLTQRQLDILNALISAFTA